MSARLTALLWTLVLVLCVCIHFLLGSIVMAAAGVTMIGVWTGSLAWTGWCGLVNFLLGWFATTRIGAYLEDRPYASFRSTTSSGS